MTIDQQVINKTPLPRTPLLRTPATRLRELKPQLPWVIVSVVVLGAVLLPALPLQIRAFTDNASGLRESMGLRNYGEMLWTTLTLGVGALAVAMVLGILLALCMHSLSPKLRRYLSFLPITPMVIPAVAHVVGFVFLFSPENGYVNSILRATPFFDGTSGPINVYQPSWIIAYTGVNLTSFVYLFVYTGLRNLGNDYAMASRVNGAGTMRTLFTITLPLLRPSLLYAAVVAFLLALGQFTGPLMLGRREGLDVITTRMYEMTEQYPVDYPVVAGLGTPLIVVAIFLIVFQKRAVGNQNRFVGTISSTKAADPTTITNVVGATIIILFALFSAILPILATVVVAFSQFWTGTPSMDSFTTQHFSTVLEDSDFWASVQTTLVAAVSAVLISIPVGMIISIGLYNRDRLWAPIGNVMDTAANLPLTLPASLMGFGFLFVFSQTGVYGSIGSLIAAYTILMIPYSVRYQLATLMQIGRHTTEASNVSGASQLRTFLQVILPLARSGIASSTVIMFILIIHEFGVSLLLRAPDVTVLSVLLFDAFAGGSYPQVAVMALFMSAITAIGVMLGALLGGSRAFEKM